MSRLPCFQQRLCLLITVHARCIRIRCIVLECPRYIILSVPVANLDLDLIRDLIRNADFALQSPKGPNLPTMGPRNVLFCFNVSLPFVVSLTSIFFSIPEVYRPMFTMAYSPALDYKHNFFSPIKCTYPTNGSTVCFLIFSNYLIILNV